jgi:hypothetical protein
MNSFTCSEIGNSRSGGVARSKGRTISCSPIQSRIPNGMPSVPSSEASASTEMPCSCSRERAENPVGGHRRARLLGVAQFAAFRGAHEIGREHAGRRLAPRRPRRYDRLTGELERSADDAAHRSGGCAAHEVRNLHTA